MFGKKIAGACITVRSDYFLAYSRVKLDRAALETQSLLWRPRSGHQGDLDTGILEQR